MARIHDLGFAMTARGVFQSLDSRASFQRHRQPSGEDLSAEPVQNRDQLGKTARHRGLGNVHGPNLVRARHGQTSKQAAQAQGEVTIRHFFALPLGRLLCNRLPDAQFFYSASRSL